MAGEKNLSSGDDNERQLDRYSPKERSLNKNRLGDDLAALPLLGKPPTLAEQFQNYYMRPDTLRLQQLFQQAWENGLFRLRNGQINPITPQFFSAALDAAGETAWEGFIEQVLTQEKQSLSWWARIIQKKPTMQEQLNALSIIVFLSDYPEKQPLKYFLSHTLTPDKDLDQQMSQLERRLVFYRLPENIRNPLQLDQIWASFYATGANRPVRRIIGIANGQYMVSPEEILQRSGFPPEMIMKGAAYSLVTLARLQERIAHIIYDNLAEYEDQPVYRVLLTALEAAKVIAEFEPNEEEGFDINWNVPPDWQS